MSEPQNVSPPNTSSELGQEVLNNTRYLSLAVDEKGVVTHLECPALEWHIDGLCTGRCAPDVLLAIIETAGLSTTPQLFPYVRLAEGVHADVHIVNRAHETQIILQDISEGHRAEHRLQQKAHEVSLLLEQQAELSRLLEQKRIEAEQASQAKSRFIASMSHEFRSPISSIMAHAGALQKKQPDAVEPAAIQRASWYLLTLVENLLEQARMGEGEPRLQLADVNVAGLLEDMQELFGVQASSRGLDLQITQDGNSTFVYADELRLRQVLVNLLSNAIRYTRQGSIKLTCTRAGERLSFDVADTGIGIEQGDIEKIFMPFTRVNHKGDGGAGLGLTISRHLIRAMRGELCVDSEPGKGSRFSFTLPAATGLRTRERISLEGMNILLVEDDDDLRGIYEIWLEDWGAIVRSCSSYEQALAAFDLQPADLVWTDHFLETGNGTDLLKELRARRPGLITVLCSGSDSITSDQNEHDVIDCMITKPIDPDRLEARLLDVIDPGSPA